MEEEVDSGDTNNVDIVANELHNLHFPMFIISGFTSKKTSKLWGRDGRLESHCAN